MNNEKTLGYVLLFLGLGIIFFAIFSASAVFNGSKNPPKLFQVTRDTEALSLGSGNLQLSTLLESLMPLDHLNKSADFMFFLFFMWFMISAGGKISSIGSGMINGPKIIKLKVNEHVVEEPPRHVRQPVRQQAPHPQRLQGYEDEWGNQYQR